MAGFSQQQQQQQQQAKHAGKPPSSPPPPAALDVPAWLASGSPSNPSPASAEATATATSSAHHTTHASLTAASKSAPARSQGPSSNGGGGVGTSGARASVPRSDSSKQRRGQCLRRARSAWRHLTPECQFWTLFSLLWSLWYLGLYPAVARVSHVPLGVHGQDLRGPPLQICLFTADFWALKGAGGTATAYHLLGSALSEHPQFNVTLVGVSRATERCRKMNSSLAHNSRLHYECLEPWHFQPPVLITQPWEPLSHATARWLAHNLDRCDLIHAHEWGGTFIDVVTMVHFRQLKPGLRIAIEPHGGHFWSTQGLRQRPMDVTSLRIDHAERMGLQMADMVISPTRYMLAFLRQRGWRLPVHSGVIPNIISDTELASSERVTKPVWRLCFFSRLEDRKGIKVFVEAVSRLKFRSSRFEVLFVGTEGMIDMLPSSMWLKQHTAGWDFPTRIVINAPREKALSIVAQEGTLLVLASLVDNMPYVLAEAVVQSIPFVVFDVGGVLEMIDPQQHADIIVWDPTPASLAQRLTETIERGHARTAVLHPSFAGGQATWVQWHVNYAARFQDLVRRDEELLAARATARIEVEVVALTKPQRSYDLYAFVCGEGSPESMRDAVLLLPEEYQFAHPTESAAQLTAVAQALAEPQTGGFGAFTFGAQVPTGEHSFPSAPTWMLYDEMERGQCVENVPVLIQKAVFCEAYLADARTFRYYYSWVLSTMLGQAGLALHTYPLAAFRVTNFTASGYSCQWDKVPRARKINTRTAGDLYRDAEDLLRMLHLAQYPRPLVSLRDDFLDSQGHRGWRYGFVGDNRTAAPVLELMQWSPAANHELTDGQWGCPPGPHPYMYHFLLHPCARPGTTDCCGRPRVQVNLRFTSYFTVPSAMVTLAYEVYPACGDGFTFSVRRRTARAAEVLHDKSFQAAAESHPVRERLEWRFGIAPGDTIDFAVDPHDDHDCDGVYIVDVQVWRE